MVRVSTDDTTKKFDRYFQAPPASGQLGAGELGRPAPRAGPGRLAQGLVGLVEAARRPQGQAQPVQGLAIVGIGIKPGEGGDGGAKAVDGELVFAPMTVPPAQGGVRADISRLPTERLAPVILGPPGGVVVLSEVHAGQVQLLGRGDGGGRRGLARRAGSLARHLRPGNVGDKLAPVGPRRQTEVRRFSPGRERDVVNEQRPARGQVGHVLPQELASRHQAHRRRPLCARDRHPDVADPARTSRLSAPSKLAAWAGPIRWTDTRTG